MIRSGPVCRELDLARGVVAFVVFVALVLILLGGCEGYGPVSGRRPQRRCNGWHV